MGNRLPYGLGWRSHWLHMLADLSQLGTSGPVKCFGIS